MRSSLISERYCTCTDISLKSIHLPIDQKRKHRIRYPKPQNPQDPGYWTWRSLHTAHGSFGVSLVQKTDTYTALQLLLSLMHSRTHYWLHTCIRQLEFCLYGWTLTHFHWNARHQQPWSKTPLVEESQKHYMTQSHFHLLLLLYFVLVVWRMELWTRWTKGLRGETLDQNPVAEEISKPPFFGSWSPVGIKVCRVCSIHVSFKCFESRPDLVCHVTTMENV